MAYDKKYPFFVYVHVNTQCDGSFKKITGVVVAAVHIVYLGRLSFV